MPSPNVERLPPPIIEAVPGSSIGIFSLEKPVVNVPTPKLDYPRIEIPVSPSFIVPSKGQETKEESKQKERALKSTVPPPPLPAVTAPKLPIIPASPVANQPPGKTMEVNIAGYPVNVPTPAAAIEVGATTVIGTTVTLATVLLIKQGRQLATPALQRLARNIFKFKIKSIKPVLHFLEENGVVHVIRYDGEGVKLLNNHLENPEQYLRDLVDADHLFEADHKIIIDEPVRERFTKEGAKRFNYFVPAKEIAKKLAARFVFG